MIKYNFVALPKIYRFLSGSELKVFVTMFDEWSQMKNEDGWYYRSQKQLCEDTSMPLRTLQRTIKKLLEKGVILATYYNDGVKLATYNKANEYKINMDKVIELSKEGCQNDVEKGVKNVKEGCQNGTPSKNKENNNKINIYKTSIDNVTIDTLQVYSDTTNEDWIDSFDDEEWVKYEVKRSSDYIIQSDDVNNINSDELDNISSGVMSCDSANNNLKKENEMSDNGTNGMNVMSECNERQARENESSESEKKNITSTQVEEEFDELFGLKDITSKGEHNVPVQTPKDMLPTPDPLPLFRQIDNILREALDITEVEPFKAKLKEALQLMEQIKPINKNAFTRCCNDSICWFKENNWNDLDMFFVASNFKRDVERMKKIVA